MEHAEALLALTVPEAFVGAFQTTDGGGVATSNGSPESTLNSGSSSSSDSTDITTPAASSPSVVINVPITTGSSGECWAQAYDLASVAAHAMASDCWYILYGKVYDFTDYVDLHPGGARRVFQHCGTDATAAYARIRRHDEALLAAEGMSLYVIGILGAESGQQRVPC